ncbi:MAG: ABC transporter permease, partial [Bacteroidota bacterium]
MKIITNTYRNLKKSPIYSALAISGLIIGITVFLSISLFVYGELTVDNYIPNHENIYRLEDTKNENCFLNYALVEVLENDFPEVEAVYPINRFTYSIPIKSEYNNITANSVISAENSLFEMLDIEILSKTGNKPLSGNNSIAITESAKNRLFGNEDALGKNINISGFLNPKITAIVKDFSDNSSFKTDFIINSEDEKMRFAKNSDNGYIWFPTNLFIKFKGKTDVNNFSAKFSEKIKSHKSVEKTFSLRKLDDMYFTKNIEGSGNIVGDASFIIVLSIIAFVVLVISLINYLNYSTAMQFARQKEIGIRKVNGAGSQEIFINHLLESIQLLTSITLIAIVIVYSSSDFISNTFGKELDFSLLKSPIFIVFELLVFGIVALISGLVPLITTKNISIVEGINNSKKPKSKNAIRNMLTTIQFTSSIVLIASVIIILKQLSFIGTKDLGFDKDKLLKISIPRNTETANVIKKEINQLSFVEASSNSNGCPGAVFQGWGNGNSGKKFFMAKVISADIDFFKTLNIEILKGRSFMPSDLNNSCVINETAYKKYDWKDLEGKKFMNGREGGYNVVGVVKNFNITSLHSDIEPVVIYYGNNRPNVLSVKLKPGNVKQQISQLRKAWGNVVTNEPFDFSFYDSFFDSFYKKEQKMAKAISLLAIIALILTAAGILGQVIQTTLYKTKEIGIRKVNGATVSEIMFMLNKDFIKWVVLSFIIATPIAWYTMNKWLENFAYKTELSWWVFAL